MSYPTPFTSTSFTSGAKLTVLIMYNVLLTWLNAFLAAFTAAGNGFVGSNQTAANATFATSAADYAGSATVTFTVPTGGRRYRMVVKANFAMVGGTNGHYTIAPGYCAGTLTGTLTLDGNRKITAGSYTQIVTSPLPVVITVASSSLTVGETMEGDVFLAAGTYTAFAVLQRGTGGGTTDLGAATYTAVYDVSST